MAGGQALGDSDYWIVELTKKANQAAAAKAASFRRTIATAGINAANEALKRKERAAVEQKIQETARWMIISDLSGLITSLDQINNGTADDIYRQVEGRVNNMAKRCNTVLETLRTMSLDSNSFVEEEFSAFRNQASKAMIAAMKVERGRPKLTIVWEDLDKSLPKDYPLAPFFKVREKKIIRMVLLKHWGFLLTTGGQYSVNALLIELMTQHQLCKSRIVAQTAIFAINQQLFPVDAYYHDVFKKIVGGHS